MSVLAPHPSRPSRHIWIWLAASAAVLLAQMLIEHFMGRIPICECGYVKLFEPGVNSSGNSQHLADWYTPSHIIHGFLFYGLGALVLRGKPLGAKLLLAVVIESAWEIAENSPIIIDRYRTATMALGYTGDSIVNSLADIGSMAFGFWLARNLPWPATVAMAIGFELMTLWVIRDNLALNILMLLWPVEAIRQWQAA